MMKVTLCFWIEIVVLCYIAHGGLHKDDSPKQGHDLLQTHSKAHEHRHHQSDHRMKTKEVHSANSEFAFQLYGQLVASPEPQAKNVFFSPLSVSLALAALSTGARGKTHQQLFNTLGFNKSNLTENEVNQAFQKILLDLNQKPGVQLSAGSAVFLNSTFTPSPVFVDHMKVYYLSDGFTVDFTKTEETKAKINKYVQEKTQGKIEKLVNELDPGILLYLLSYIYFKGNWEIKFDPNKTIEDTFHVDINTNVTVQMMSQKEKYDVYYDKELSTTILELHYNKSVSIMFVLPKKEGLADLEKTISHAHVTRWHRWMKPREYNLFIPKFSITTSYSLKDVLSRMGMPDVFGLGANFSGISDKLNLAVSDVMHLASLEVDEVGVTALGFTKVELHPLSFIPTLKFDHPFMVILFDPKTMATLFMGKVVNPAERNT